MIKKLKENLLGVISSFYALVVALMWLAMRVNWAGISKALGADKNQSFFVMETPLLFCILMWLCFVYSLVALFVWGGRKKAPFIVSLSLSVVFTVLISVVIALGSKDYIQFIMPKFWRSFAVAIALIALALLLFFPTEYGTKRSRCIKVGVLLVAAVIAVFVGYDIKINKFTYNAAVFAVEDDYQIIFSTSDNSIVWVEIDGQKYYDLYAGSMKSKDLVHKVSVPQNVLDEAKEYTICAQQIVYRGPFGGYKGKVISEKYNFKPVDSSDGLTYYTLTDVHGSDVGAIKAASYVEDMDFLVILGDSYSMIDSEFDAEFTHSMAARITKGEKPCVYARGNHEIKGEYAEDLYKYVGAKDPDYYYWFTLSDVFGIVLDIGEDHDDDWWEYYGTSQFVEYQNEQTAMLEKLIDEKIYEGYNYKLVCCHIPIQYVNYRHNHEAVKAKWTELLNTIAPDNVVSGHQHDLYPFFEDTITMNEKHQLVYNSQFVGKTGKTYNGYVTDFHFTSFIAGRRGKGQTDELPTSNHKDHIGLVTRADIKKGEQLHYYLNSDGEVVSVFNPFVEGPAQKEFITRLKTVAVN